MFVELPFLTRSGVLVMPSLLFSPSSSEGHHLRCVYLRCFTQILCVLCIEYIVSGRLFGSKQSQSMLDELH